MAFVLSSISGNLISAASAGYAPTNGADVSAIASAYSESAASGKLDSSASSSFYSVDNPSGFITGLDLSNYATTAYVDSSVSSKLDSSASSSFYTTANESGFVDSAYVDSAVSGKADSSALSSYALSSDVSGVIDTVSSNSASWGGGATGDYVEKSATDVAIGTPSPSASGCAIAHGLLAKAQNYSVALAGYEVTALNTSFAQGYYANANQSSFVQGVSSKAVNNSFAQGTQNTASGGGCFAQGYGNKAYTYSFAQGYDNMASGCSFAQGYGNIARNSSIVFGQYNLHNDGDTATGDSAAFTIGDGSFGARHDLMLVTKDGEITMFSSTADTTGTGILSSIRAISAAATGGGVDSATVSAIASSYVESGVSGKADSSALSSYALSADVSGTIDLVSTQSANWGGSALALSAGPGVKLEKVGDTLVASTDETVLFSGANSGMVATNLTEPLSGFNSFKICFNPFGDGMSREWKEFSWADSSDVYTVATFHKNGTDNLAWYVAFQPNTDGTTLTPIANKLLVLGSTNVQDRDQMNVYRVVGINRTAEA